MSDSVIDAIREVDPCPTELAPPPIETVLRRLHERSAGDGAAGDGAVGDGAAGVGPPASRRRPSQGAVAVVLSSLAVTGFAVLAIALLGRAHHAAPPVGRAGNTPGTLACRAEIKNGVLPVWARAGFSDARPRMTYALGASGRIAAILWAPLDSPPATTHNNKILWVSRVPVHPGSDLTIRAQRMNGAVRLGAPVKRSVMGGPGPSIINLPVAGCWRLTLRWSGWTDHVDLRYQRPG